MRKIFLLFVFGGMFFSPLAAQNNDKTHFGYAELGSIGGYPAIGGGYRTQVGYHGFDISGKFFPLIPIPAAEIRGLYLFYPQQKGIYFGSGLGFIREGETLRHGSLSFDAVIGYQWKMAKGRDLFFQVEGITPFKKTCCSPIWPAISIGIGF